MKIILRKTFLKDIQKVSEPQKSQVKLFLEELYASPSISESSHSIKKLKGEKPLCGILIDLQFDLFGTFKLRAISVFYANLG